MGEGLTSRREWRVEAVWPDSGGMIGETYARAEEAYAFIAEAHRLWPMATVTLEEREHITRVVERRVVPRTEEGA